MEEQYLKYWKVEPCFVEQEDKEKCWCKMVVTIDFSYSTRDEDEIIIGSAAIDYKTAKVIVEDHNFHLVNKTKNG